MASLREEVDAAGGGSAAEEQYKTLSGNDVTVNEDDDTTMPGQDPSSPKEAQRAPLSASEETKESSGGQTAG